MAGTTLYSTLELEVLKTFMYRIHEDPDKVFENLNVVPLYGPQDKYCNVQMFLLRKWPTDEGLGPIFRTQNTTDDNLRLAYDLVRKGSFLKVKSY